jgi:hypothetical protein
MPTDDQSFEVRVAQRAPGGDVEALLQRVRELIDGARPAALSAQQVKVDRDEVLDLLDQAIERLPDEVRSARWLMKEREEFLARTRREADDILAAARGQAKRLAQLETVLERTMKVVATGRARLRGNGSAPSGGGGGTEAAEGRREAAGSGTPDVGASAEGGATGATAVFDQDRV